MIVVECEMLIFLRKYRVIVRRKDSKDFIWLTYIERDYEIWPLVALIYGIQAMGTGIADVQDRVDEELSKELEGG